MNDMTKWASPLRKVSATWWMVIYLTVLALVSAVLIILDDYDWVLFIMVAPILLLALDFSRKVYLPLLGALTLASVIVTRFIVTNFTGSLETITMMVAMTLLATEAIHRKAIEWRQVQQRLKENEIKYETVFRTGPDVMTLTRLSDGLFVEVNDTFVQFTGYSADEVIGKTVTDLHFYSNPQDREQLKNMFAESDIGAPLETTLRNKDGSLFLVQISARRVTLNGEIYIISILRDITQRKKMEEDLRRGEARNRALLDAMPDTMFRIDRNGNYLDFQSHDHSKRDKPNNYVGNNLFDMLPTDLATLSLNAIRATLQTGKPQVVEYHLDRNNKSRDFEARMAVSGPDEVLSIVRDITERKKNEHRLQEAEERYRSLVEQVESIIYLDARDDNSTNLYISPQVEKILGYSVEEWHSSPDLWLKAIHPDDHEAVRQEHLRTNALGEPFHMEYRMVTKDGRTIWVEDHASLTADMNGELTQWQGVFFDISTRKHAELVQGTIYRIAQAALTAQNLDQFYDAVHDILSELIPANNMYIALYEPGPDLLVFPYWADEHDPRPLPQKPMHGLTEYVLRNGKTSLVDANRFTDLVRSNEITMMDVGTLAVDWLGTPLKIGEQVIGVLTIQSYNPQNRLGSNEAQILEFVSGQIAMTIDRMQREEALRESEERYSLAVHGANDGIWDWNLRTNEVYYSQRWKSILGVENLEFSSAPEEWFSRIHPLDLGRVMSDISSHLKGDSEHFECEYRMLHGDGQYRWVLSRGLAVRSNGQAQRVAGSMTDSTARKAVEEQLLHDAMHDPLTNLPNRAFFINLLSLALERARRRTDYSAAILFLDLDRFKIVNESLGHQTGDQLLQAVAERLQASLRPGDTLSRLSGDEFAVLLEDVKNISETNHLAADIQSILAQPFNINGHEVFTSVTIGIVTVDDAYENAEELMRDADSATYRGKANGRGRIEIFDTEMHAASLATLKMEADLRRAIERDEFRLYYQPIVSLRERKVRSFEALLRWQHPTRGIIMPGEFISLAEETGLILPIGRWVLKTACNQVKIWQKAGFDQMKVSVNISARQLQDEDLVDIVQNTLLNAGMTGRNLQLEITEYTAMRDLVKSTQVLTEISRMGIEILIDDFGTSYSSMGYLKRFPVNYLKIAQTFIRDVTEKPDDAAITNAIIALAHAMDMSVVAEGVENQAQFNYLLQQDCDEIQGYYINPAMPGVSTTRFLQSGLEDRMGSM